jgi:hypothetical protein
VEYVYFLMYSLQLPTGVGRENNNLQGTAYWNRIVCEAVNYPSIK